MTDFILTIFGSIIFPISPVIAVILHMKYDEVIRPLIGLCLLRKPLLRHNLDAMDLFRIGNKAKPIKTMIDLDRSARTIQLTILKSSWFRQKDVKMLRGYYLEAMRIVQRRVADEAWRESQRWARAKKTSTPTARGWRAILALSPNERDPKVIKTQYRRLASAHHPDKGRVNSHDVAN